MALLVTSCVCMYLRGVDGFRVYGWLLNFISAFRYVRGSEGLGAYGWLLKVFIDNSLGVDLVGLVDAEGPSHAWGPRPRPIRPFRKYGPGLTLDLINNFLPNKQL